MSESYKLEAQDRLEMIAVVSYPHMKNGQVILDTYRMAADGIVELFEQNNDFSALNKLNEIL